MSSGANISDINALSDLKAAFGRFGDGILEILPSIQKEFEDVQEWLAERERHWQRQVENAQETLQSARDSLQSCENSGYYDDDNTYHAPDCGYERDHVWNIELQLGDYEEALSTVHRWRYRIDGEIIMVRTNMHHLSRLASTQVASAQAFLEQKIEMLQQYAGAGISRTAALQSQPINAIFSKGVPIASVVADIREKIRTANYISSRELHAGINQTFILTNSVKVVFKPADGEFQGDIYYAGIQSGTQYLREKAASILDEILGLGLVPPTEIITHGDRIGSAQLFRDKFKTARYLEKRGLIDSSWPSMLTDRQRHDWQLLDELTGNIDRHSDNWMLCQRSNGEFDLALIDNGLCLSELDNIQLHIYPASGEILDVLNRSRIEKLLAMENNWRPKLNALVGDHAIGNLLDRARQLLKRNHYE